MILGDISCFIMEKLRQFCTAARLFFGFFYRFLEIFESIFAYFFHFKVFLRPKYGYSVYVQRNSLLSGD